MSENNSRFYVVMGVAASGKTTVGEALAAQLACPLYDGDDFHPAQNVAKMASGVPLNDEDRAPWLARLAQLIEEHLEMGKTGVLACSALKKSYREQLRVSEQVDFIYLEGDFDLIWSRIATRENHYMKPAMLHSQFATLEAPQADEAVIVSIDQSVDDILAQILQAIT